MQTSVHLVLARIIATAAKRRASDIHFSIGSRPVIRVDSTLSELSQESIVTKDFIGNFLDLIADQAQRKELEEKKNTTFVQVFEDKVRLKVNAFYQKGNPAVSVKLIPINIPAFHDLGLAKSLDALIDLEYGLVVIAGPYGSGRTTTIASLIEEINKIKSKHILIMEKPLEYVFTSKKSNIEQREIGKDALSYTDALRYSREEDNDILVVDDTEEREAIPLLLEFASGGKLVFFLFYALTVTQALEKIIGSFSPSDQPNARVLLARSLKCLFIQRLVPRIGGGKMIAQEILFANSAVQNIIETGRVHQLTSILQTSHKEGMISLDQSLAALVKAGEITPEDAQAQAEDKENFSAMIRGG